VIQFALLVAVQEGHPFPATVTPTIPAPPEEPKDWLVVTGDKKILQLREYKGAKIISPKEYLEL
jgi:hypothetical protein